VPAPAVKVVDASALAALLFGEPEAEKVARALDGARLVAPGLLAFELANVCRVKCRRHPEQRDALLAAFQLRSRLEIEETAVITWAPLSWRSRPGLQPMMQAIFAWPASLERSW
jgi:predicted nucleic acid-binding protein